MMRKFGRYLTMSVAAMLILATAAGCGLFGGDAPVPAEPTADLAQTIAAAVAAAIPTETPTPEPTATPTPTVPPTPDIAATVAAMLAAAQANVAPADTPVPAVPATAAPAAVVPPTQASVTNPIAGPPAFIIGTVTINGQTARDGEIIYGRPQNTDLPRIQDQTDENGKYQLETTQYGAVYDLWVGGTDSGVDTDTITRTGPGGLQIKHLTINR